MTKTIECELWLVVDGDGYYSVATESEAALEKHAEDYGTPEGGLRTVRLTLKVPVPAPVQVAGTVPEDETGPIALTVQG
jgi:hypothetical protein